MKRGYLLMNTGAPDAPTKKAVSDYRADFKHDPLTSDTPKLITAPLVNWITLPQHLDELVLAYAAIWTNHGFPLIHCCRNLAQILEQKLDGPVALGMAHGNPSYKSALADLVNSGVDEICLVWMFPQHDISKHYCQEHIRKEIKKLNSNITLRISPPFYEESCFIDPLAAKVQGSEDYILFNYHGLTTHNLKKADPTHHHCLTASTCCSEGSVAHDSCYRFQCLSTSRSIARTANIPEDRFGTSFQTRYKGRKWLNPHTEEVLAKLPEQGHKRVTVVSPAFLCDGMETLEEIELRAKFVFLEAGGESFRMLPCLNDSEAGVRCMETLIANAVEWPKI